MAERDLSALAAGVLAGDRSTLARAITLVESSAAGHQHDAEELLQALLPRTGGAVRVGITGAPGVGKSTLIEALGARLTARGHRLAVLAVDPSSSVTRGSILGDKTRMPRLAVDPRAFIRPSPSGGSLGGVARRTREALLVCEAAGHDVVLVETVGVGQSEVEVRSMVDFFLLLLLPGSGDELQGIKRGVVELADALAITKADGDNLRPAERARTEYAGALRFLTPATEGWEVPVQTCSAVGGAGIDEIWDTVERHRAHGVDSGQLATRRREQHLHWMRQIVAQQLEQRIYAHPEVQRMLPGIERDVQEGRLPAGAAARQLLEAARV